MLEKWKQRAMQTNLKKAILILAAISFILVLGFSAALYGNFKGRIDHWESDVKTVREYQRGEKGEDADDRNDFAGEDYSRKHLDRKEEIELEQIWEAPYLPTGDIALIADCGIIGIGLAIWYWLLCMMWAYQKSRRMGIHSAIWVLAAFFFHFAAVAALYLYAALKGTCTQCGKIRHSGSKYCDRCGNPFIQECQNCGQFIDRKAGYCSNCGKRLNETEEI